MKNVMGAIILAGCAAMPFGILAQTGQPGGGVPLPCWVPTEQNHTCTLVGANCAGAWCKCPGRIRCAPAATGGRTLAPYVAVTVCCEDWIGAAGTCAGTTFCVGGAPVVPQACVCTVTISSQTCPGTCP